MVGPDGVQKRLNWAGWSPLGWARLGKEVGSHDANDGVCETKRGRKRKRREKEDKKVCLMIFSSLDILGALQHFMILLVLFLMLFSFIVLSRLVFL